MGARRATRKTRMNWGVRSPKTKKASRERGTEKYCQHKNTGQNYDVSFWHERRKEKKKKKGPHQKAKEISVREKKSGNRVDGKNRVEEAEYKSTRTEGGVKNKGVQVRGLGDEKKKRLTGGENWGTKGDARESSSKGSEGVAYGIRADLRNESSYSFIMRAGQEALGCKVNKPKGALITWEINEPDT